MSTPATLFTIYLGLGLLLLTIAVAAPGKEKRVEGFETGVSGDAFSAGLLAVIALLWPLWLLSVFLQRNQNGDQR